MPPLREQSQPFRRVSEASAGIGSAVPSVHSPTPSLSSVSSVDFSRLERAAATLERKSSHRLAREIRREMDKERSSSMARSRASSYTSSLSQARRGANITSPTMEPMMEGRPLDSPLAPSSASVYSQEQQVSRQASQSSFARRYDVLAEEIEQSLAPHAEPTAHHDAYPQHSSHADRGHAREHAREHDPVDRPHSTDTYQEAQIAFKDFDGVHFDPDTAEYIVEDDDGNEIRRVSARSSSGSLLNAASMLRTPAPRPISYAAPPPGDGMVYYPAPVPRMLNLPKRLSQQPAAHVQAKRRSQMLRELPAGARQSAPWIPPISFSEGDASSQGGVRSQRSGSSSTSHHDQPRGMLHERMSMANAHTLPPQLRASMFFEHQAVAHDVEVKSESAVATLDSILAASVSAPVNAFTDHPYAGDVRKSVYAREKLHQRTSTQTTLGNVTTVTAEKEKEKKLKKRRSSSIGDFFRRKSTDIDGETKRPGSRGSASVLDFSQGGNKLKKRQSQLSLGDDLGRADDAVRTPDEETTPERRRFSSGTLIDQAANATSPHDELGPEHSASRPVTVISGGKEQEDADLIAQDFKDREEEEDLEETDAIFAQPTTLLAELQVRKAQLKSRNRTAATAYPGGMHSTLLQLDAVEQINAKKRQKQRIALAWEDPDQQAEEEARKEGEDEDVPLGVLFPSKDGLINRKLGDSRDWNRPLGLMEKREMEDNEPLSSRRTRLNPNAQSLRKTMQPLASQSQLHLAGQPDTPTETGAEEDEGETLGQRLRRLKTKEALDATVSDLAPKEGDRPNSDFTDNILAEFPDLAIQEQEAKDSRASAEAKEQAAPGADEEETLGQRRARLQREREASGDASNNGIATSRPPLQSSNSLANLLSANPVGQRGMAQQQQAAHGTLLHTANEQQMKQRQQLMNANMRSAGYMLDKPLVDAGPNPNGAGPTGGLIGEQRSRPANGAFTGQLAPVNNPLGTRVEGTQGLLGAQRSRPANGGFAGGAFNTNAGAAMPGLQPSASTPMFGVSNTNAYFASPTMGYGSPHASMMSPHASTMMPGYRQMQMQKLPTLNTPAYYALNGGHVGASHASMMPSTNPTMGGGMMAGGTGTYAYGAQQQMNGAVGMDGMPLDPNQRDAIDRWRMGIA